MKTCSICKIPKLLEDFYTNQRKCKDCHRTYMRNYYRDNPDKREFHVTARKQRIRDEVHKYKESKGCLDCGTFYPFYVLQFDHLDNKEFVISTYVGNIGIKRMWDEIAKCDVVCSNCHAERTHKRKMERK